MKVSLKCPTCTGYADMIGKQGTKMFVYECHSCGTKAFATRCQWCSGSGFHRADVCQNCDSGIIEIAYESKRSTSAVPAPKFK